MQQNKQWQKELSILASIIEKVNLEKTIKWGAEVFTFNGKNVISYVGFKNHFALWFFNGVFLKDKYKVLGNAQEGKTKSLRHWKFYTVDEIDENKILEYIKEAIEVEKKGLKIVADKFKPIDCPEILLEALNKNKSLKSAFEKLSPGKQKEYMIYINEAKQEITKLKRVEKICPMILANIGLNDKYK